MSTTPKVKNASKWISITNISNRLISFLYFTFIFRSLTIEEIGIFALITSIIQISSGVTNSGFKEALIQKSTNNPDVYFTVWVIELIRGCLLYIIIISMSNVLGGILNIELDDYLFFTALTVILNSAVNIRVIEFTKTLNYKGLFFLNTFPNLTGSLLGLLLLYLYPSLWTVLILFVLKTIIYLITSYIIVKPFQFSRLNFTETFRLSHFGKWIMAANIVFFISVYADDLIIAKYLTTSLLGVYAIAFKYANIGVMEFGNIIKEVSFPTFSILQNDKTEAKKMLLRLSDIVSVIIVPISGLLIINANEIIFILIKQTDNNIVPVFQILCFGAALRSLCGVYGAYFKGIGKSKFSFQLNAIRSVVLLILIFPLMSLFELIGVALASALSMLATFVLMLYFLKSLFPMEWKQFLILISKNVSIGFVSGVITYLIIIELEDINSMIKILLSTVLFFALNYFIDKLFISKNSKTGFTFLIKSFIVK